MKNRRRLKIGLFVLLFLTVAAWLFHLWFVRHIEYLIRELVRVESNGRLSFEAQKVSIGYWDRRIEFDGVSLHTVGSDTAGNVYEVSCPKMVVQLQKLRPLLFKRQLLIDSAFCRSPYLKLVKQEPGGRDVKLVREWGDIYKSLQQVLGKLYIQRFEIDNGRFEMTTAGSGRPPLVISGLDFAIDKLFSDTRRNRKPIIRAEKIYLALKDQHFDLGDGKHKMGFRDFFINTQTGRIFINNYMLRGFEHRDSSGYLVRADTLQAANIDFLSLYETGLLRADSLYLASPVVELDLALSPKEKSGKKRVNIGELISRFTGELQLGDLSMRNATVKINARRKNGRTNNFAFNDASLQVMGLAIGSNGDGDPVRFSSFDMLLKDYRVHGRDSSFVASIDSLRLQNNRFRVHNFSLYPTSTPQERLQRNMSVQTIIIDNLSLPDLFFDRIIRAGAITLEKPVLYFTAGRTPVRGSGKSRVFQQLADSLLHVDRLRIDNGQVHFNNGRGTRLVVEDVSMESNINRLITLQRMGELVHELGRLQFKRFMLQTPSLLLKGEAAGLRNGSQPLLLKSLLLQAGNTSATLKGVSIGLGAGPLRQGLKLDHLHWNSGEVRLDLTKKRKGSDLLLQMNNIRGKNTQLVMQAGEGTLTALVQRLDLAKLEKEGSRAPVVNGLRLLAENIFYLDRSTVLRSKALLVSDREMRLQEGRLEYASASDTLLAVLPQVLVHAGLNDFLHSSTRVDSLVLEDPQFSWSGNEGRSEAAAGFPVLDVGRIRVKGANATVRQSGEQNIFLHFPHLDLTADGLSSGNDGLHTKSLSFSASQFQYDEPGTRFRGDAQLLARNLGFDGGKWKAEIPSLSVNNGSWTDRKNDTAFTSAEWRAMTLGGLTASSGEQLENWGRSRFNLQGLRVQTPRSRISIGGINSNELQSLISVDSISFQPAASKDSLLSPAGWQTDHISFDAPRLLLNGWNPDRWLSDNTLSFGKIEVVQPLITVYRDKAKPMQPGTVKPLPTKALQHFPLPLFIDTVSVSDGFVTYTEKSLKTRREGSVVFRRLNGSLSGIKSRELGVTDSLTVQASAYLMDKALVQMRLRQSYTDSLAGFLLTATLEPTPLEILNPVLEPLASVSIRSGYLDTLRIRAIGREYLSIGSMDMFYHRLRIRFIADGDSTKREFLRSLMSFAANNFVIRTKNKNREGIIYFPRARDRSIFNYLARMVMSGIASSTGARSSKKYLKEYREALKERDLPAIE
jgi:hypothetical protein